MKHKTLDNIPLGKPAVIVDISDSSKCKLRLYEIGITPESKIIGLFESPLKNPKAYLINGTVIAIRNEEAKNIKVIIE
ncbi:MAG: ferrous iron transport protein A [Ruminococcaceae bacterium]|nr:ferrous iron transport protein A [Oscillospiraceae bacterium]